MSDTASTASGPPPMSAKLNLQLSVMMFLQYAIWGAWLPILYPYLISYRGLSGDQTGWIFMVGAVGALLAPFVAGQIADRYFSTEKFLGLSHLIGAVLIWQLAFIESFMAFLIFSLIYSIVYSPTLSLTNSLAFHHLPDRDRDFGRVRVWGTIGWIVAGVAVGHWLGFFHTQPEPVYARQLVESKIETEEGRSQLSDLATEGQRSLVEKSLAQLEDDDSEASRKTVIEELGKEGVFTGEAIAELRKAGWDKGRADAFRLSAILGVLMGLFCFALPHTPPQQGEQQFATAEALGEIRRQPLVTLFLLAVPISCIHQFYFVHASQFVAVYQAKAEGLVEAINSVLGVGGGGLMTIGQMTEILVLAAIPLFAKKMSRKALLAIGIVAYALRMFLFAYIDEIASVGIPTVATLIAGISLHGLCFGCFIFVAFMVVDEETTGDVRATAQSLFNLVIVGIGIIAGSYIASSTVPALATIDEELNYTILFAYPMWASIICLVALLIFYPNRKLVKPELGRTNV